MFWPFVPKFSKMSGYIQFFFFRDIIPTNIFRLRLMGAFSGAWLTKNKFLTELNSQNSAVQFLFVTFFHEFNLVRFCSNFKLDYFHKKNLQWWNLFVDVFSHLREIGMQTLLTFWRMDMELGSESVNMLTRGVVAAMRVVTNQSKVTPFVLFCFF